MAGRCRESLRKESLPNGDLCSESDADSTSRKLSLLKIVGRGKKRESLVDRSASPGPEEEPVEEVPVVKPREPLSGKLTCCIQDNYGNQLGISVFKYGISSRMYSCFISSILGIGSGSTTTLLQG